MNTKLTPLTRVQSTAEAVRRMILDGEFRPGSRLQAQMLADQLGVSRTPVYDALASLQKEGLLEYEANRGYSVRKFDLKDLLGAFDVRLTLEGLACRLVAEKGMSKGALEKLRENINRTEEVLYGNVWTDAEQEKWRLLNMEFHDTILAEADNTYLTLAVVNARSVPPIDDRIAYKAGKDGVWLWPLLDQDFGKHAYQDHVRVFEAIEEGQGSRAENMMKEHIFSSREKIRRLMGELLAKRQQSKPSKR